MWHVNQGVAIVEVSHLSNHRETRIILSKVNHLRDGDVASTTTSLIEQRRGLFELKVLASTSRKGGVGNIVFELFLDLFYQFKRGSDLIVYHLVAVNGVIETGLSAPCGRVDFVFQSWLFFTTDLVLDVLQFELVARLEQLEVTLQISELCSELVHVSLATNVRVFEIMEPLDGLNLNFVMC
jgi:hypothetical protein